MTSELAPFTRELEECRRRWNQHSLRFVLEIAGILKRARKASKSERRWNRWMREETHMNRSTAYRYLRVLEFVRANVSLKQHLAALSIAKIYALSRLEPLQAARLIQSGRAAQMNDASLNKQVRLLLPSKRGRPTIPNLIRSITAAVNKVERVMYKWQSSHRVMPPQVHSRILSRLRTLTQAVLQMKRVKPMAM